MLSGGKENRAMTYKAYFWVWLGLIVFTGVTVSFAGRGTGRWGAVIALLIAGAKSGLVLNYFMHMRTEKGFLFKLIIPGVLAVLLIFIALTFSDVAFR
jgi:cytochrome c oxidase subunit IV